MFGIKLSSNTYYPYFILAVLLALTPVFGFFSVRALSFMPGAFGVLAILFFAMRERKFLDVFNYPLGWVLAILGLGALSSFWAVDSAFALERVGKMALIF
ncbi:MAG: hypothetical protein OIF54_16405, partial [Cohaesibacter sp.]|nr:hypothetical protein [Cohaesibacter sp.]